MTLADFQPWIYDLLTAAPELSGVTVLKDDGTYPGTPQRETALGDEGLVVIVMQMESAGVVDMTPQGDSIQAIYLPVIIEENVTINRETNAGNGVRKSSEMILEDVQKALGKQRKDGLTLLPFDEPFKNIGKENGVQRYLVNFKILKRI